MEKQSQFKVGISEVDFRGRDYSVPVFDDLTGVEFVMWAYTKKEVAEKIAKIISTMTHTTITYGPEPYLSSALEWVIGTSQFDVNITIKQIE